MKIPLIKMIEYINKFWHFILCIFGATIVLWIIFIRFILERLPKNIPINLSEFSLYIIIYICCIYFYIIITLIKPRAPHSLMIKLIEIIYKPIILFDETIKSIKKIHTLYKRILDYLISIFNNLSFNQMKNIYIFMYIIPRIILIIILIIDTFYFHKLNYIYKILLLGAIPLFHKYLKYSFKVGENCYIRHLEGLYSFVDVRQKEYNPDDYEQELHPDAIHHKTSMEIKNYVNVQLELKYSDTSLKYVGSPFQNEYYHKCYAKEEYGDENAELNAKDYKNLEKEFHTTMLKIYNLNDISIYYSYIDKEGILKWIKIFIFSGYFICWLYILCKSFHTVEEFPLFINIIILLNNFIIEVKYESPF